jgi:hypothetical protein
MYLKLFSKSLTILLSLLPNDSSAFVYLPFYLIVSFSNNFCEFLLFFQFVVYFILIIFFNFVCSFPYFILSQFIFLCKNNVSLLYSFIFWMLHVWLSFSLRTINVYFSTKLSLTLETIYFDGAVSFCFEILTFSAKKKFSLVSTQKGRANFT